MASAQSGAAGSATSAVIPAPSSPFIANTRGRRRRVCDTVGGNFCGRDGQEEETGGRRPRGRRRGGRGGRGGRDGSRRGGGRGSERGRREAHDQGGQKERQAEEVQDGFRESRPPDCPSEQAGDERTRGVSPCDRERVGGARERGGEGLVASCVICAETFDSGKHRPAVGACDHGGICALCFMRLRLLMEDRACPLCKASLEHVYVFNGDATTIQPFASLNIWGTEAGPGYVYDERASMFMPRAFHRDVFAPMQGFRCSPAESKACRYEGKDLRELRAHLQLAHAQYLCEVCLSHKKVFVGEQTRYAKKALAGHMEHGEADAGFSGHPRCKFCRNKPFYDLTALFHHLRSAHYSCDVCERLRQQEGLPPSHRYHRDYPALERHFRQEHHLCEDPVCLSERFVVFAHALDLRAHVQARHAGQGRSRRLELDVSAFRVRGQQGGREGPREGEGEGEGERTLEWTPTRYLAPATGGPGREGAGEGGGEGGGRRPGAVIVDPLAFPALAADASFGHNDASGRVPSQAQDRGEQRRSGSAWGTGGGRSGYPALGPPPTIAGAASRPRFPSTRSQAVPPLQRALKQLKIPAISVSGEGEGGSSGASGSSGDGGRDDPMLTRNRRFAEALGIAKAVQGQALTLAQVRGEEGGEGGKGGGEGGQEMDAFRLELERPVYPRELLDWAISPATKMDVLRLERKITAFLSDKKEASLYLKPMAKEERRRVHLLAEFYGLRSLSYDNEPRRFVALIKAPAVGPSGDNSSAGGLPGPTGARAPVVLLSEAAAAEVLARRHTGAHSNGSSAHSGASFPLAPLLTPPLPPSSASLLVANIGELSGKTVTDRLRCLYPSLPLLGYHFREPPPDASPRLEPFPPALVVHLGSVQALAALLDEAKARPADLHPFVLKASLGGASVVIRPVAPPPGTKAAKGGNLEPPQGQSSVQDGQQRWGSSVLLGRLKPRSLPPPSSTVSSSSSPLSCASTPHKVAETRSTTIGALLATGSHVNKQRGRTKGGNAGHEGGKLRGGGALSDQVELRPGEGIASNRWAWLEMDGDDGDSEEEEEEREEEEDEEEEEEKQERKEEGKECRAGADKGFNRDGVRDGGAETDREGNRREGMKTTALSMDERVGDGTEEIGDGEEGEEEEEWEEEELEVACSACTFKHLCDYCPMCMTPRPTGR